MKKIIIFIYITIVLLNLSACNYDPYSGRRPYDYGDARWSCDLIDAYFTVDLSKEDYYYPEGEMKINNTIYKFKLYFVHQTNQIFLSVFENKSNLKIGELCGECSFSEKTLTIEVDSKRDTIFDGRYPTIIFIRT